MSIFAPVLPPESKLRRYRRLSPNAGVYVSPIQLGGMSIGDKWDMGAGSKEDAFKLMDAYFEAGGNFIDTASTYHGGVSEEWIGEWAESRGVRDQVVIATKYTDSHLRWRFDPKINHAALAGNNIKALTTSLEISLKALRTTYIDILYVHWWDYASSIEEVMNALHGAVAQGKVLYLGASNMPAWVIADCNRYAKMANKSPFVVYQGEWNVFSRGHEREMIPLARAHGMALAPWNVFAQGKIRTDAEEEERRKSGRNGRKGGPLATHWERSEDEKKMCKALEKVASEVNAPSIRTVALAYHMQKTAHVFPVVGVRSIEQLKENVRALDIRLTPEHIKYIESILPFDIGGPYNNGIGEAPSVSTAATIFVDWDPVPQPIVP